MATTENITAFLAAWDAAMLAYDVAHGTNGVADILGAGFDMNSTDSAGLWTTTIAGTTGIVPALTPNSAVPVFWTDGTDTIGPLSYDDLGNANKVAEVLNGYFGIKFKMWRVLSNIITCIEQDSYVSGSTLGDLSTVTQEEYNDLITCLEGRASYCTEPQGLELPGTMG